MDREFLSGAARRVEAMRGRRLLVLGDAMLDRYIWGQASRVSPEAPVLVVEAERETERLGGAANVASNACALGAESLLVGAVGADPSAEILKGALDRAGVSSAHLLVRASVPTILKTRIVAHQQQVLRVDHERKMDLGPDEEERVIAGVLPLLDKTDAVVISDYGKGMITAGLLARLLPEMERRGLPVCVDPKERHVALYRGVSTLTPNTLEAGEVVGTRIRDAEDLDRVAAEILSLTAARSVLITRGKEGMSLFEPGGKVTHLPTVAREVYDVTGAGDTVVACFALTLAAGGSLLEAAFVANHAAGLVIREVGTAVPRLDDLIASIKGHADVRA